MPPPQPADPVDANIAERIGTPLVRSMTGRRPGGEGFLARGASTESRRGTSTQIDFTCGYMGSTISAGSRRFTSTAYSGDHKQTRPFAFFTVEMVPLDAAMLEAFPDLRFTATQVQKAHDLAMTELYSPEEWRKGSAFSVQRSLGPEVNQVADVVNADALLFATYSGFEKSGGEIAKDVAVTALVFVATLGSMAVVKPWSGAVVQVCLVDAATGEVLYANRVRTESMFSDNAAELTRAALEALKRE